MPIKRSWYILPVIVLAQFAGTSLWFVGNAVINDIQQDVALGKSALGFITSAVQFGFIAGTLFFSLLTITDRFPPSRIFFVCSILGAAANASIAWWATDWYTLLFFRALTGFFLAGIYPVGMKIAADWFEGGLGKALGYLLGALVMGTAFPFLLRGTPLPFSWQTILQATSVFSVSGGLLIYLFVPDGPYRKRGAPLRFNEIGSVFKAKNFRSAAFGYFGHMWELYTFWAFLPILLKLHLQQSDSTNINVSLWAFIIIASGSVGCIVGGHIAQRKSSTLVAFYSLLISGACCLMAPFLLSLPTFFFLLFLLVWGTTVVADSPQFSALVAQTAPAQHKGTALTLVVCIGFAITILSIQFFDFLMELTGHNMAVFLVLAAGPLFGLAYLKRLFIDK